MWLGLFQIGKAYAGLLAARRELPSELYELQEVEDVSPWVMLRRVTLPMLLPTRVFTAARDVASSLPFSFVLALVITEGGPTSPS